MTDQQQQQFCKAMVKADGAVHLGRVQDGVCLAICKAAGRSIILPVAHDWPISCMECLKFMRDEGVAVNVTWGMVRGAIFGKPGGDPEVYESQPQLDSPVHRDRRDGLERLHDTAKRAGHRSAQRPARPRGNLTAMSEVK